jgi:hypothetical protein
VLRKKIDNHIYPLAIYFTWYNFVRQHKTLRASPAMAAGLPDRLWSMEDMVALLDAGKEAGQARALPRRLKPFAQARAELLERTQRHV